MYRFGDLEIFETGKHKGEYKDKVRADNVMLANAYIKINVYTKWKWLRRRRRTRAKIYFFAVAKVGGPAYLNDKI